MTQRLISDIMSPMKHVFHGPANTLLTGAGQAPGNVRMTTSTSPSHSRGKGGQGRGSDGGYADTLPWLYFRKRKSFR